MNDKIKLKEQFKQSSNIDCNLAIITYDKRILFKSNTNLNKCKKLARFKIVPNFGKMCK